MDKFRWAPISLEQYKQKCRFLKEPYCPGGYENYLVQQGYIQFKIWHKRAMDNRDAELKKAKLKK
jgi:hypothetical protein